MNREIVKHLFPKALKRIDEGDCPTCGKPIKVEDFRNKISIKEFQISGMCQECQDEVFGKD